MFSCECVWSQRILQAWWAPAACGFHASCLLPFRGSPGGRGVSVLLLRALRLGAGRRRCGREQWALLWSPPGPWQWPLAPSASQVLFPSRLRAEPAGPGLRRSGAPFHFPVNGKGPARTRGLCGVSRPDKHRPALSASAGPSAAAALLPARPRGGDLPCSCPNWPGLSTACGYRPWLTPRPPAWEKS